MDPTNCLVLPVNELRMPAAEAVAKGVSSRCSILYGAQVRLYPQDCYI